MTTKINRFHLWFLLFSTAFLSAYWLTTWSDQAIVKIENQIYNQDSINRRILEQSDVWEYFKYYNIYFEKWMTNNQSFTWAEKIVFLSDRAIFQPLRDLNFKEDIYRDSDGDWIFNNWKLTINVDENNSKTIEPRALYAWTLNKTCDNFTAILWWWDFRINHIIWATLEFDIKKTQTIYTYLKCK